MARFIYIPNDPESNQRNYPENMNFLNGWRQNSVPPMFGVAVWQIGYFYCLMLSVFWSVVAIYTQMYWYLLLPVAANIFMAPNFAANSRMLRNRQLSISGDQHQYWEDRINLALIVSSARCLYPRFISTTVDQGTDRLMMRALHARQVILSILALPGSLIKQTFYDMKSFCVVLMYNHLVICELLVDSFNAFSSGVSAYLYPKNYLTVRTEAYEDRDILLSPNEKEYSISELAVLSYNLTKRAFNIVMNMLLRWCELLARPLVHMLGIIFPVLAMSVHQMVVTHAMQPAPGIHPDSSNHSDYIYNSSYVNDLTYCKDNDPVDWSEASESTEAPVSSLMSDMLETKNQIDELFDVLAEQLREEVTAKVTSEVTSEVRSEVTAEVRSEVTAELTADALERLQRKTTQTYTAIDDSETAPGATNGDMNREFTSKSHFTSR
jgi:hypothetical protein